MPDVTLMEIAVLLAALAIAAPISRMLGIAPVLGYLAAGVILGPFGARSLFSAHDAQELMHIAEFGVVMLLFIIGLELRPKRLIAMRSAVFGLGSAQVAFTAVALGVVAIAIGVGWQEAMFTGAALALSSTAFALQLLEENNELSARHGRLAFAVLLFQDLAAIPLIALAPFFAVKASIASVDPVKVGIAVGTIVGVVVIGRYVLDVLIRVVAWARVPEAMTAAALLTIVGVTLIMQSAGLTASLGAFIAGALLAESAYRHQLEADIKPFEGLLLGMFFTAIGMTLDLRLLFADPARILGFVALLMVIKAVILFALGRWVGLESGPARRFAFVLAQAGEFAFVLLSVGQASGVLGKPAGDTLAVIVTISMAMTPVILAIDKYLFGKSTAPLKAFDDVPDNDRHVVIAGFGRFGQIVARVLRAKKIPFTALDIDPEQVEFVKKFGSQAFYGDASRPDILEAAQTDKARAFVLAIDDVEASMRTAEIVKARYPHVPIFARARNRNHAHRLLDLKVQGLQRETYLSALDVTRQVLKTLGLSDRLADRTITTFRTHDERRLIEDYKHYSDMQRLQERARNDAATLEKLFLEDVAEETKVTAAETRAKDGERKAS